MIFQLLIDLLCFVLGKLLRQFISLVSLRTDFKMKAKNHGIIFAAMGWLSLANGLCKLRP